MRTAVSEVTSTRDPCLWSNYFEDQHS